MKLDEILDKAILQSDGISDAEIAYLLDLKDEASREKMFEAARLVRERSFEDKIFLYGFVYFSTYCRNQCTFCYYRCANDDSPRYRKSMDEILEIAEALTDSGVHLLDLTMGEDPYYVSCGKEGYNRLVEIVKKVKEKSGLPLMISPGVVPEQVLARLKTAGAEWYACYQETHTRALYDSMRLNQPYEDRWNKKIYAKHHGMLVEEGLLIGIGDQTQDVVHSLRQMKVLQADQVRTMTFVPQKGTPLSEVTALNNCREVNLIAVMRLLFPNKLIPASLDVEGIHGLKARLNAGANVVTSIIPPQSGLAGVSQSTLDISEGYRTVTGVTPILTECGLRPATKAEYAAWVECQEKVEVTA